MMGIFIGVFFDFPARGIAMNDTGMREQKIREIINYIDYEYVDQVDTDSILDMTIANLLTKLDPHSAYIPGDQVAASEESIKGSFDGIGIEFKIFKDSLTVVRVLEDGPSEKAGLQQGDRILTAGEKVLYGAGLAAEEVVSTLKGESGTQVALNVYRPSEKSTSLIKVERDAVPLKSVQSGFMVDESTGYLKLIRFSQNSGEEVEEEIRRLKAAGAERLIFDLRDNPGGLLASARDVADAFLGDDELIVFTKNRRGDKKSLYASAQGGFQEGEVVVLINEGSASASEIVAGALQDNDRGWIVGRRSFGKGLVQEEMTLRDGSKLRLTTRRYYTPSGRSIQKPYEKYDDRFIEKSGYEGKSPDVDTARVYVTAGGRKVYGGGGITPDVTVEMDTSSSTAFLYHLALVADFDEKAFAFVDKHREDLSQLSEEEFVKSFEVDSEILEHFFGRNADRIKGQTETNQELIKARVKAYIGYNLFGSSAFQHSFAEHDPMIAAALKTLLEEKPILK